MPSSYNVLSRLTAIGADETRRRTEEIRAFFGGKGRFTYEGLTGRGGFSLAFRIVERLADGTTTRRLVVKRAQRRPFEPDLRNEIRWMKLLTGAEHIARVIASHNDSDTTVGRSRIRHFFARLRRRPSSLLVGLTGPILVMEYLENASLKRLWDRLCESQELLPNRVLWAFFLCLVRACVAMAYPPNRGEGALGQLETIPPGVRAGLLEHRDMHLGNIMIGDANGRFPEHSIVPVLKLIDFGSAWDRDTMGAQTNLFEISKIMVNLIIRDIIRVSVAKTRTEYQGYITSATEILPHGNGANYPTLDPELRDFLARCLALEPGDRPGLQEMLRTTRDAVANKTTASYAPNEGLETDEVIAGVLQRLVYDADADEVARQQRGDWDGVSVALDVGGLLAGPA